MSAVLSVIITVTVIISQAELNTVTRLITMKFMVKEMWADSSGKMDIIEILNWKKMEIIQYVEMVVKILMDIEELAARLNLVMSMEKKFIAVKKGIMWVVLLERAGKLEFKLAMLIFIKALAEWLHLFDDGADYPVENIGGFIGYAKDSSIRSSYALVTKVNGSYRNVGGFVGQSITSTFMYNFVVGNTKDFLGRLVP